MNLDCSDPDLCWLNNKESKFKILSYRDSCMSFIIPFAIFPNCTVWKKYEIPLSKVNPTINKGIINILFLLLASIASNAKSITIGYIAVEAATITIKVLAIKKFFLWLKPHFFNSLI